MHLTRRCSSAGISRRHHPRGCDGARRRLLCGRLLEMAVRRTRQHVPLHATRSARRIQPRFTGWVSHESPFSFDPHTHVQRTDAMRMMGSTPSIPAYHALPARHRRGGRRTDSDHRSGCLHLSSGSTEPRRTGFRRSRHAIRRAAGTVAVNARRARSRAQARDYGRLSGRRHPRVAALLQHDREIDRLMGE
jgi:hypothetical protein